MTLLIVLIICLLALSGMFSGSETAFASANKVRLKKAADAGRRSAVIAQYIADNFTRSLSTILVGNNLVNIAASSAMTVLAISLFPSRPAQAQTWGGVILTVLLLIFGEVMPKIIAAEYADTIILLTCRPIRFFMTLFYPVVAAVTALVGRLAKLWTREDDAPSVTQNELLTLVDAIEDEGVFTEKEGELIKHAIEFADSTAREIMVPRVDMEAFDITDGVGGLSRNRQLLKYSRIPVYRQTVDDIIGILPAKKFMRETVRRGDANAFTEEEFIGLLTEPVYVHMTRPISSILKEFMRTRSHMAVVVDEYGGTMGILTLEDILEEIVGEIYDEHDEVERDVICADEDGGAFVVDASMNIYDLFELCGVNPEAVGFESEYTTVGGFTTETLDRFPKPGDSFEFGGMRFEVTKAKPMRAEELRIVISK